MLRSRLFNVGLVAMTAYYSTTITPTLAFLIRSSRDTLIIPRPIVAPIFQASVDEIGEEAEEEVEPGKMRVSEIKAELDMRGVTYSDCFDKESLADRLKEARAEGKADPEILNKFNKAKVRQNCQRAHFDNYGNMSLQPHHIYCTPNLVVLGSWKKPSTKRRLRSTMTTWNEL